MILFKQFLFAFLSAIGFAILFSIPKDSIIKSGIVGALGMVVYTLVNEIFKTPVAGTLFAALTVGLLGEILARHYKKPATVFIIPGIIPLVPGAGTYYTMLAVIEKNFNETANTGSETFFIAVAIAVGLTISSSLSRSIKRFKNHN
ncbi:MAG TPA: threonine/serine exporter family protein [Tissierellales bacterium]|nr:threonine/serine exporter family protein [Tissierellales bacterium]